MCEMKKIDTIEFKNHNIIIYVLISHEYNKCYIGVAQDYVHTKTFTFNIDVSIANTVKEIKAYKESLSNIEINKSEVLNNLIDICRKLSLKEF